MSSAEEKLAAVMELHQEENGQCTHCIESWSWGAEPTDWPCDTAVAFGAVRTEIVDAAPFAIEATP